MKIHCVFCGKEFSPSPYFLKNARFCSIKCKNDYEKYVVEGKPYEQQVQPPESQKPNFRPPKEKRVCEVCGTEFLPSTGNQRFCSKECREGRTRKVNWEIKEEPAPIETPTEEPEEIPIDKPVEKKQKTFGDWTREADECGMSYGKYRHAVEKLGKTYEELKAEYERGR